MKAMIFSDPHFSVDSEIEEEKWFPPACSFLNKIHPILVRKFLNFWDNVTQKSFSKMLRVAASYGPYDVVAATGDYTPGANESGMVTLKAEDQYQLFKESLDIFFPNDDKIFAWGDHDAGYKFDVSGKTGIRIGTEQGGMSQESVNKATELIGPPFGFRDVGKARFIWISTNLIRNVGGGSPHGLQNLQAVQERFLFEKLEGSDKDFNFILLHDPTAISLSKSLPHILHKSRDRISAIFHGHFHAEIIARAMRRLDSHYKTICDEIETHLVPAPWGMLGIGKGFIILEIEGNNFKIKRYPL